MKEQEQMLMNRGQGGSGRRDVLRIVGVYVLFSSLWIYLSDTVLEYLFQDPAVLTRFAIYKGLLFILCTAALLYKLISRYAARQGQAELQLLQYYDIVHRMQVGLYVYHLDDPADDRSLRLVTANPASSAALNLPTTEIVGRRIDEIFPHLRTMEIPRRFAEVAKRGTGFEVEEFRYQDARLPTRYYSFKAFPLPGDCVGVLFEDVTPRRTAEEQLRTSEELFRTLCNAAPIGIFMADHLGNNIYSNPRWEEISGLTAAESLGFGWVTAIHPEDRDQAAASWREAVRSGSSGMIETEARLLAPGGRVTWTRALASPVKDPTAAVTSFVGTIEDITELRRAREEMLKIDKLDSLGLLAGGIAHDFNNILTAILGNISLGRLMVATPEALVDHLEEAEKAAARAKGLTRQLLTFARGGEPVRKFIDIRTLIREAAGFATHGSAVKAQFDLAEDLHLLEADEDQVSQVFHNLIINAVQAMPGGGEVSVVARNVDQDGVPFVEVTVTDSGVGIPEKHLQRIFDPYFTTKQQGSGLGLATCYSIIRKHGGVITVESSLGQGTAFRVCLPALDRQAVPAAPLAVAATCGMGRVLVMDDERPVRKIARAMLEQLGYEAECVANGREALELYRKRREEGTPFAAVIMDLTIPGGCGGKEAIAELLALDSQARVIVSSGYSTDPVVANFRAYGFHGLLGKPYRLQEMSAALKELFGERP